MVKLEMEQVGLPEYGTELVNPDLAEVARPIGCPACGSPIPTTWTPRFAIAKSKEFLESHGS